MLRRRWRRQKGSGSEFENEEGSDADSSFCVYVYWSSLSLARSLRLLEADPGSWLQISQPQAPHQKPNPDFLFTRHTLECLEQNGTS
mmetsp:Transcript_17547/g.71016  ORF Transcript_17547/g.71016 Transcript_17547/m.71016 type:complete len:87 (-) Transcript_17547:309-569(-)